MHKNRAAETRERKDVILVWRVDVEKFGVEGGETVIRLYCGPTRGKKEAKRGSETAKPLLRKPEY